MNYQTDIEIYGLGFKLSIEYTAYPATQGAMEGGLKLEPDEDAVVEIHKIHISDESDGNTWSAITLPDSVINDLGQEIMEKDYV